MEVHKKSKNKTNIWSSKSTLGYISRKKKKTLIWKDTCTPMFLAALCTRAKIWTQPKCPLAEEWVEHSGYNRIFSSVQSLSRVWLFVTPRTAARQASLSITNFWSPLKPMSIESVMPSNHLILWPPLLLLHQGLSQWVRSSHQVAKVLEFHLQQQNIT